MIVAIYKIFNKLYNIFTTLLMNFYCRLINVKLESRVLFKGTCSILKVKSARIEIGKNTVINSNNYGYHLNMFTKCKLLADRPKAVIKIGSNCRIHATCLHAFKEIIIGNRVLIAANTQIIDGNGHELMMHDPENRIHSTDNGKPIQIGDDVWIGTNVLILGGVTIGNGAVIAANTLVNKDVLPHTLVGGNPMTLLKEYSK